jgi:hypothetical protein
LRKAGSMADDEQQEVEQQQPSTKEGAEQAKALNAVQDNVSKPLSAAHLSPLPCMLAPTFLGSSSTTTTSCSKQQQQQRRPATVRLSTHHP